MAYPGAISGGNLSIIRRQYHRIRNLKVAVAPLVEFASATVDTLPADFPFADVPITGASADWANCRRGEYVRYFDSGTFVAEGSWRKNSSGTTTFHGLGIARGDTGKSFLQAVALAAGQVIKSYTVRVPKSLMSRLSVSTYYKRWDLPFSSFDPSPQCNIGQHRLEDIGTGTTVTLEFQLDTSTSTSWLGGTLSVTWVLPTGASYAPTYTSTSNPTQMIFPPGAYIVAAIVADTARATTERQYRHVFVTGDDGGGNTYTAFSDAHKIVGITNDVRNRDGRSITFEVLGTSGLSLLYTGAPVVMTWIDEYSTDLVTWTSPTAGTTINNVFGYIRSFETSNDSTGVEVTRFTIETPLLYAQSLPFAPQYLIEAASPAEWWEVTTGAATAAFIPFYVGDLHSRYFQELHDYYPGDGADYQKNRWDISGENIADAMRTAARPFLGAIGNTSDGSLYLTRNLNLETTTNRDATAERITFDEFDVGTPIQYQLNEVMEAGETEGAAFIYSGEGDDAKLRGAIYRAGKGARMQGVRVDKMPDFIAGSAVEAKSRVGHWHAMTNSPVNVLSFTVLGSRDVYDPAMGLWIRSDMAAFDPLATPNLYDGRLVVNSITTNWVLEKGSWLRSLQYECAPETYGQPATQKTKQAWGGGSGITPSAGWCYTFDFVVNNGGWSQDGGNPSSYAYGVYTPTVGWEDSDQTSGTGTGQRGVYISISFASTALTSVSVSFDGTLGTVTDTSLAAFAIQNTATYASLTSTAFTAMTWGSNLTKSWSGNVTTTGIAVFIRVNNDTVAPVTYSGSVLIHQVTICGTGANPFV